jgi:peptide/nickel transport system ATP-binding protein
VSGLCVEIGSRRIVDDVSFTVMPGERVCLLGASGSGKSMTAAAIVGLLPPDARVNGSIVIGGSEVAKVPVALRPSPARAAMVFQDSFSALNPLVSIGTQIEEPLRRRQGLSQPQAREAAIALLRAMSLPAPEDLVRRCPAELSGGQRQRVCIALALACKTGLLVADEPTTALDVVTQAQVLRALKAGTRTADAPALLFITHDLGAAAQLCERAIVIAQGEVIESGDLREILMRPRHDFTRAMVDIAWARQIELPSPVPVADQVPALSC